MGDIVEFRAKKLSGFIPSIEEITEQALKLAASKAPPIGGHSDDLVRGFSSADVFPTWPWPADTASLSIPFPQSYTVIPVDGLRIVDIFPDTACSEINPDSGDCA